MNTENILPLRPQIQSYGHNGKEISAFVSDMLSFRKKTEKSFSVLTATQNLRKISPALVSLITQNKRKLTLDRADEFAKLLALTPAEKYILKIGCSKMIILKNKNKF